MSIVRVVFNIGVNKEFDYITDSKENLTGKRVLVDFNRRKKIGIVVGYRKGRKRKNIKPLIEVLDEGVSTLSEEHITFAYLLQKRYPYSIGELLFLMVPPILRKRRILKMPLSSCKKKSSHRAKHIFVKSFSLRDRLNFYRGEIKKVIDSGSSVIFCVPSLSFLEWYRDFFRKEYPEKLVVIHSYQREKELFLNWKKAQSGGKLILGTRMAIFCFPKDLSLILIDEENSPYYFHPEKPFYHLQEVAFILSKLKRIRLILGGGLPTLSTFKMIKEKKLEVFDFSRSRGSFKIVNVKTIVTPKYKSGLNPLILEIFRKHWEEKKSIIVFFNKKGFASYISCIKCGYLYMCPRCSVPLRYLQEGKGFCYLCGYTEKIPDICKECASGYIKLEGIGIERLEKYFKKTFPEIETSPSVKERITFSTYGILDAPLEDVKFDISMVIDADFFLSRPDFDVSLKLYNYLSKISYHTKEDVYIFTQNTDYYLWEKINESWFNVYEKELSLRKEAKLPPFYGIARITFRGKSKKILYKKAKMIYHFFDIKKKVEVFGPMENIPFKKREKFYYSVIVKSKNKYYLIECIKGFLNCFRRGTTKIAVSIE